MHRYTAASLLVLATLALCAGASAADLTPSAVLIAANQYNGQEISVTGIISGVKIKPTANGATYQTFKLCDANACLDVVAPGTKTHTEGEQFTGSGHFWMFVQRGYYTNHNEFDLD